MYTIRHPSPCAFSVCRVTRRAKRRGMFAFSRGTSCCADDERWAVFSGSSNRLKTFRTVNASLRSRRWSLSRHKLRLTRLGRMQRKKIPGFRGLFWLSSLQLFRNICAGMICSSYFGFYSLQLGSDHSVFFYDFFLI